MEVRLVGLHDRQLRRDRAASSRARRRRSRDRTIVRRGCTGRRARARSWAADLGRRPHAADPRRLPELVLRPAGREAPPVARAGSRRSRRGRAVAGRRRGRAAAPVADPPPTAPTHPAAARRRALRRRRSNELRYAQKAWGTRRRSRRRWPGSTTSKGDLRRAITLMRRAYPQFLAAGGEGLPAEILQMIFPLTYWDSIKRNAADLRARSLRGRRADRAGVDVRSEHRVGGERVGADADRAGDGPPAGARRSASAASARRC